MKPEIHIESRDEEFVRDSIREAVDNHNYTEIALSATDLGHLLMGNSVVLNFLDDNYELTGMIEVHMTDGNTYFKVPSEEEKIRR